MITDRVIEAKEIIEVCKRLQARDLLAAGDGNVSMRLSDERILFTPTGRNKALIKPRDLAVVAIDNRVLKGKPSSERLMHLEVYRRCPKARAVVHAHPPTAIAWSIAHPELKELPAECMSELILAVGRIPIAPYARPGTQAMGEHLAPYLPACRVLILARHGALAWGESLEEAANGIERLEHSARILAQAQALGGLTPLPAAELEALRALRRELGDRTL